MKVLMRIAGTATVIATDAQQWLLAFDVDAHGGRGDIKLTTDKTKALRFDDMIAAFECWKRVSTVRPKRPDGKPNRPLTAYTVTFDTVES